MSKPKIRMESTFVFGTDEERVTFGIPVELARMLPQGHRKIADEKSGDPIIDALQNLLNVHLWTVGRPPQHIYPTQDELAGDAPEPPKPPPKRKPGRPKKVGK